MNFSQPPTPSLHCGGKPVVASYLATFLKKEMLHVYRQLKALRAVTPVVFTQKQENMAEFPFDPLFVIPKPRTHALRRVWQKQIWGLPITIYRSEARRILAALHRNKADVLHVYFGHIGVHLLPLLEICDRPVVVSFHGADAQVNLERPAHRKRTERMLTLASLILVRSRSLAEKLGALGCHPGKIRIHRTGIPLNQIPFQLRSLPADGRLRFLQACRLIPKKGLPTTLRAFSEFTRQHPQAHLTIAGEGPQLAQLQAQTRELGLANHVSFTGFVSQSQLRSLFEESHLFLHPSELGPDGDQEGVPNAMLEAMASGLPVVATSHGGIIEAVENGKSGLLVGEKDSHAMFESMRHLTSDPDLFRSMSAAASARVAEKFELERQARTLESIYFEAMSIHGNAANPPSQALEK
jgi:colanic acid/amylovoran biosynthesis glycosyltransferase